MSKTRRLTGGYYGTRNADFFPELFVKRAVSGSHFIDITAGTGQFPYRVATERQHPVILFERCPYVGYLLQSIFEGEIRTSAAAQRGVLPAGMSAGYLSKREDLIGDYIGAEAAQRVDFLAEHAIRTSDAPLKHAIGRALNMMTFRSINWSRTLASGRKTTDLKAGEIDARILRTLAEMVDYHKAIPGLVQQRSTAFIGDSCKLVPKIASQTDVFIDAVVYADPAWPWAGKADTGSTQNPYAFAYEQLSSVIDQTQHKLETIWTRHTEERIKSETLGWINDSFKAGARYFISCTQDTNFPHPDVVRQWYIDAGFKVPHTMVLHDYSRSASKEYLNYWFFITP